MTSRQKWNALGASASWVLGALFIVACMEEGPPGEEDSVQTPQVSKGMITASFNRYMETGTDDPFEQFTLTGVFARYSAGDVSTGGKLWDDTLTETDIGLDALRA